LIHNQWYAAIESGEVPAGKVVGALRVGGEFVFRRDAEGNVSCLRDF